MNLRVASATTVLIVMAGLSSYYATKPFIEAKSYAPAVSLIDSGEQNDSGVVKEYEQQLKQNMIDGYNKALSINKDTVGWIHVEDSRIDYPVMSGNNNYYLNYNSSKQPSKSGSIFLDESQLWIGDLSVIHGHNMLNGTMFSDVRKFNDEKYFNDHLIYLYDGENVREYKPIAFLKVAQTTRLETTLKDRSKIQQYAQSLVDKSMYGKKEVNDNPVLIMNTCVSDGTNEHYILVSQQIE